MTRREIWDTVYGAAAAAYEPREARAVAALVCEDRLGLRFTDVIVEPDAPCPLRDDLQRLAFEIGSYRPAQYIAGFCRFCGRKFSLEEGVLIPRPETEELVRTIVERHRSDSGLRILDIGTGSGCIAVTLAAELRGLMAFRTPHHIAGILLNDCKESLYKMLRPMLEKETGLPVVGFLPPMPDAAIESRHLGLKTAGEIADLQQKIQILTAAAQKNIDWPRLLALFDRQAPMAPAVQAAAPTVRIAVAQDEAFCFTYAETLESLQAAGAELCYFSPLRDAALPQNIGGLYLPGGYPELYAAQLAANTAMRCAINTAVQRGLPTVAECGGFLYLGQTLEDDAGTAHPMAGVLPGQGFRVGRLVRFGYAALTPQADSMLFRAGEPVPVHEFHHWDSTCNGTAFAAQKANGRHWDCGFANGHLYAGFPHLYWAGTPLPQRFVTAAAQYAQTKTGRTV